MSAAHSPLLNRFLDGDPKAKDELRQLLKMSPKAFDQYFLGENLERLREAATKPSDFDQFLAGKPEIKDSYRGAIIKNCELSPEFADRWVSDENIIQLREAKRIGIHPESIFVICCECATADWSTCTVSDVKETAKQFRKMASAVRKLLNQTLIAVSEVPEGGRISSSLSPLPKTAPRFSGYGGFTMLAPERFHSVREVADEKDGLLEKCAQDLEAAIPALKTVNPSHRPKHIGQSQFEKMWNNLVGNSEESQHLKGKENELGAWFFEVTFGKGQYQATSLAKRKQRKSRSRTS